MRPTDPQAQLPTQSAADPLRDANLCLSDPDPDPDLIESGPEMPLPNAAPDPYPGPTNNQEWE
jgi:hypothetical protein